MWPLIILVFVVLGGLSLRGVRWAYVTFIVLGIAFFPARTGFHFEPRACELAFSLSLVPVSLANYPHVVLFGLFYAGTMAQFERKTAAAFVWAGVATLLMGVVVELAQGLTGRGHCRSRDLLPDAEGALLAAALILCWNALRRARSPRVA
jgi:hypothetical protein